MLTATARAILRSKIVERLREVDRPVREENVARSVAALQDAIEGVLELADPATVSGAGAPPVLQLTIDEADTIRRSLAFSGPSVPTSSLEVKLRDYSEARGHWVALQRFATKRITTVDEFQAERARLERERDRLRDQRKREELDRDARETEPAHLTRQELKGVIALVAGVRGEIPGIGSAANKLRLAEAELLRRREAPA